MKNQKLIVGGGIALLGLGFLFFGRNANAAEVGATGFAENVPGGSSGQNTFTKALQDVLTAPVNQSVVDAIPGDNNAIATAKNPRPLGPGPKLQFPSSPPVGNAPPVVRQSPRTSGGGGFSRSGPRKQLF